MCCHVSEAFPPELFTASAWSEQVLSGAGRRDREGSREAADSLVRRLPFDGLGALAAGRLGPSMTVWGAVSEAVPRAAGEDGIVEEGHPFVHRAVTRDDRGARRWRSTSTS